LDERKGAKAGGTRAISDTRRKTDPNHDQSDDLQTLFEMFDLEPPSPQQTVTTLNREHRGPEGPLEPNQGDHQPRLPIRTCRRPRRANVEPR
uniref:Nucleocapsid n=1 Tax=Toxocara canis TaxID=6265 RepID=A0A183TYD3_TOXCA